MRSALRYTAYQARFLNTVEQNFEERYACQI
jgi:hypothetical protein